MQPTHLRDLNERAVYRVVRELRPISRAEVARQTELSKPTVSQALRNLEAAGLVAEASDQKSADGRAGVLFGPVPHAALAVGAELEVGAVHAVLTDLDGNQLATITTPFDGQTATDVLDAVVASVGDLLPNRRRRALLRSVVVGAPGIIDPATGVLQHAGVLPALDGSCPSEHLESALGVPVTVINDVDLAAIGEMTTGQGRGCRDFSVISIGAGMGAALVLDGQLYTGARGGAGEIDDIPFRRVVPSKVPVSPALDGLSGLATSLTSRYRATALRPPYTSDAVFAARAEGDRMAIAIVEHLAEWASWFAASIAAVVDPELIVLTGSIGAHEALADSVRYRLADLLLAPPKLAVSELGSGSTLAGAVATASEQALATALDERLRPTA